MSITLFPHQERGVAFLTSGTGTKGLFFGMGTGKTLTALYAAKKLPGKNILIIAPPIALPMWLDETKAHLGVEAKILKTGKTAPGSAQALVVSYAIAAVRAAELRDWLAGGILICDESHALKSATTKRTKAILGRGGIAAGAAYSWMLTGTPITRWNDDMYTFLARADLAGMEARLGGTSKQKFDLKFTVTQQRTFPGAWKPVELVVGNKNTAELAEWVYGGGHALRVDLDEVFASMPPLTHRRYEIPLDADAQLKAALKELEASTVAEIRQKLETKEPALATIRRQLGLGKVKAAAAEIAERVESGQNVLVGAWHTDVIDALQQELQGNRSYSCASLDGRSSITQKKQMQEAWNAGKLQVFIGQIAAMGVSLNLQHGGTQIIVVEEDWAPEVMSQFYARLWRYGQQKHVHVDTLTTATKLDRAVARISDQKAAQAQKFHDVGRAVYADG